MIRRYFEFLILKIIEKFLIFRRDFEFSILKIVVNFNNEINDDDESNDVEKSDVIKSMINTNDKNAKFRTNELNRKKLKKNDDSIKSFVTIDRRVTIDRDEFAIMKIIVDFNEKLNVNEKLNNNEKLNVIDSTWCTNEKNAKFNEIELNDKKLKKNNDLMKLFMMNAISIICLLWKTAIKYIANDRINMHLILCEWWKCEWKKMRMKSYTNEFLILMQNLIDCSKNQ